MHDAPTPEFGNFNLALPKDLMDRVQAISKSLNVGIPVVVEHLLAICFEHNPDEKLLSQVEMLATEPRRF